MLREEGRRCADTAWGASVATGRRASSGRRSSCRALRGRCVGGGRPLRQSGGLLQAAGRLAGRRRGGVRCARAPRPGGQAGTQGAMHRTPRSIRCVRRCQAPGAATRLRHGHGRPLSPRAARGRKRQAKNRKVTRHEGAPELASPSRKSKSSTPDPPSSHTHNTHRAPCAATVHRSTNIKMAPGNRKKRWWLSSHRAAADTSVAVAAFPHTVA